MQPANVFDTSQSIATTLVASEHVTPPHSFPSQVTDQSLSIMKPKKRKSESLDLLSWHKEVMCGSQRLLNIRIAEKDWEHATHRLFEKVEKDWAHATHRLFHDTVNAATPSTPTSCNSFCRCHFFL
ncbi:hypothetical protein MKX01_040802 [Papaver californicum]|nr:hypothetical protein MKX01_040802 [Papaver californicum]